MTAVPGIIPNTTPEPETVATDVLLLAHVPPGVTSLREVVVPTHRFMAPVIGEGAVLTVTVAVAKQVDGSV